MRSLSLLILFISLSLYTEAQVLFEIESPVSLSGVYPCMEPTDPNWNTPDLSAPGNWFSDAVVATNDGVIGSACGPLNSLHQGNIAIFHRNSCEIGQQLLNVQNEGATGALIIDTITGRPLSFGSDAQSNQINIPFVIISQDEGLAILNALNAGDTVVASFGNKQGQHPVDLGIYMERALWSSYPYYPSSQTGRYFPDTSFGVWLYNRGQQNAQDITVKFYGNETNNPFEYISDSLSLNSGDSSYIAFNVTPSSNMWWSEFDYGYEIIYSGNDDDTLDNKIESQMYHSEAHSNIISRTFLNQPQQNSTPIDFLFSDTNAIESYLGIRMNTDGITCYELIWAAMQCQNQIDVHVLANELNNWQPQTILEQLPSQSHGIGYTYNFAPNSVDLYMTNDGVFFSDTTAFLILNYYSPVYNKFAFTTDMYHDERRRQDPFHRVYFSADGNLIELDTKLTELVYFHASGNLHYCSWGIDEIDKNAFQLSPNPAKNSFEIETEQKFNSVRMLSLSGKQIELRENGNGQYSFGAEPGIYLVQIKTQSGSLMMQRLVVTD